MAKKKTKSAKQQLKTEIRKDMRTMCKEKGNINKEEITSRYIVLHSDKAEFICRVVNNYYASLEKKNFTPCTRGEKKKKEKGSMEPKREQSSPLHIEGSPDMQKYPSQTTENHAISDGIEDHGHTRASILQDFVSYYTCNIGSNPTTSSSPKIPTLEEQMQFLNLSNEKQPTDSHLHLRSQEAVLLSPVTEGSSHEMPPQYALLGHRPSSHFAAHDPRVLLNTNVPFSAFICGLQGSGKSHTTCCIIENCTLSLPALGELKRPLPTLVLHYSEYSSNMSSQPSEAAFLASVMPEYRSHKSQIPVTVLVSPSNFHNLEKLYSHIPGVQVRPFRLLPSQLNISSMLSLMSFGKNGSVPLYMAQVTRVLREMAMKGKGNFDYLDFRACLNTLRLERLQTPFLHQRLDLLDSFLDLKGETDESHFVDYGVTILDLSCPFIDQSTACILFRIAIDLFLYAHPSRGKMIVADEAHKYMTDTPAAKELTETFLNVVRQQRHLGVRLIISTQEPTISPRLIDLCSMTIIHRFSSPVWYNIIRKHITIGDNSGSPTDEVDGLCQISSLCTGEALVFAPSACLLDDNQFLIDTKHKTFKLAVRKRITWDGGQTVLCVR